VWKEGKEISRGEKCVVSMYEERCTYSDGSNPGGYSILHYSVTDDTSEKAYATLQKMLYDIPPPAPDSDNDAFPKMNKRASKAVDVA
jgi:hypothetical protein